MTELAKRAVACKGWRWMPGMLATDGVSLACRVYNDGLVLRWATNIPDWPLHSVDGNEDFLPDLTDPATLGCLLALVREACEPQRAPGDWPMVCTYQSQGKRWGVGAWLNESGKATFAALVLPTYETEAAALVAALEAAP